jgi:heme-degrading monooxygenase HmoA
MIRKNVASQTVYLPQLRLTADGSAVTTGASLVVAKDGVEAAAAGTLAHYAGGIWKYTPTQGETNCAIMALVLTATGADTVLLNILTTAANPQDGAAFGLSTISTIDSATDATIAVVNDLDTRIPAALVSGRIDSSVGAMANNVLTASAIASDAITDAKVASDVTIASVTGAVGSVTNPVTLTAAYDAAKTASTQTSVNTLASYVDTEVAAIKAKTDNLPVDPADASDIAASFATVNSTLATIAGYIDTEVAAIKAKTDNLPIDPADASDIAASFASLTSLVNTLTGYVDTEVAAIKAKTDNLPALPAAVSDIPTTSAIATAVAATQALSRLDSMIESDGAGQFRFDTIALSMGAGGAGGTDWTANERTAIRSILGFDSSGTVSLPTVGVMDAIKDKTDLITSDGISVLEDRVNESTITMQYNESTTATVNLDEDTTSATLQFVVSRPDGTDVLTIANGSITRTSTSFTITITTAVTATLGQYLWSLRDITGGTNRVVTKGVLTVQNAASV